MVTGPTGPKPPAGPGTPPVLATKPTQAPAVVTLPDGKTAAGVVRTRQSNIVERVGWTAAQAFVGTFGTVFFATQSLAMSDLKKAGLAGASAVVAALLALVKNIITTRLEG